MIEKLISVLLISETIAIPNLMGNLLFSLKGLTAKLKDDDSTLHTFRKTLAFSRIVQKDLAPLLKSVLKSKEEPAILVGSKHVTAPPGTNVNQGKNSKQRVV